MGTIETVAVIIGVINVFLYIRRSIWCWPTGIVMVCLYAYIFFQVRLYSDFGLQIIYLILQFYGWYYWLRGGPDKASAAVITRMPPAAIAGWAALALAGAGLLGYTMDTQTDADLPYWDALTTVTSLIAQYLIARKMLESWLFWIVVDVISIGVYLAKDLYATSGLYALFLVMATGGYLVWRKAFHQTASAPSVA